MDKNIVSDLEGVKSEILSEIEYINKREASINVINEAIQELSEKNISLLIDKCKYRMGSLINAHKYSSVANQQEIEKDTDELNHLVADLNNEIISIEEVRKNLEGIANEPSHQEFADKIKAVIDKNLELCNSTVRNANDVLGNRIDSIELENTVEKEEVAPMITPVEEAPVEEAEITPTEIKTDSIDELENQLNNDLQPIQEDKKDLEETKNELEQAIQVTNVEPAPQSIVAPLQPIAEPDLNAFLNQGPQEEKTEEPTVGVNEIKSAATVDEGPVLVTNVETFDLNDDREKEGPVLSRTA